MKSIPVLNKIQSSSGIFKYIRNMFWLVGEKVITNVVSLVVGVLVARYLGPANLGILSYASSIASFFIIFSQLGLNPIVTRNLVKDPDRQAETLGTAFWAMISASVVNILVISLALFWIEDTIESKVIMFMLVFSTIFQGFFVIDYFYQSRVESKHAVQVRLIQFIVSTIIKVLLLVFQAHVYWFALTFVLNDLMNAAGLALSYQRRNGNMLRWRVNFAYLKEMVRDAFPLLLAGFLVAVYTRIGQVMLKNMMGAEAVGIFSVGVKLGELVYIIPGILIPTLFPAVVKAKALGEEIYMRRIQMLSDIMFSIAFVLAVGATLFGPWLVTLLYGKEFEEAGIVFVIFIWSSVFTYLGYASSQWMTVENLQIAKLVRSALGALVNVGLNFLLIPRFGGMGAAIAILGAQMFASYFGYFFSKKNWPIVVVMTRSMMFVSPFMTLRRLIRSRFQDY